jgi:hypothetical protein
VPEIDRVFSGPDPSRLQATFRQQKLKRPPRRSRRMTCA